MLRAMKQICSAFVPPTFLFFTLFVMFSGAQRIYHPQEWHSNDCENENQILKEIKNDINELTHLVKHLQNKEHGQINNVAFYAQLTKSVTDDYVIYSHVITNEGASYDKTSGVFKCKYSGTYVFSWTIASSQHHQTTADLLVNDVSVGSTATYPREYLKGSSTGFVVYDLQVGDKVMVIVNGTAIAEFSTFSGWKLQHGTPSFYARASGNVTGTDFRDSGYRFQTVLKNKGDVYNPDNGVITIPESGIWALTISVEVTHRFDSLYVERSPNPKMSSFARTDTSSFLLVRVFSYKDRKLWSSAYNTTILPTRSSISGWLIGPVNARPTFMASSVLPTLSSHVNFTSQYIDLTDSLAGSDFRVTKPGVYLIFWNVIATNMVHATLLVNGKGAGKAITSKPQHSNSDIGSNLAILRLQKDDVVTMETNTNPFYVAISVYLMY